MCFVSDIDQKIISFSNTKHKCSISNVTKIHADFRFISIFAIAI